MTYIENLLKKYIEIFSKKENRPEWAVNKNSNKNELVSPCIPFVGKNYEKSKILLYASVENLNYYTSSKNSKIKYEWIEDNEIAINRHRYCFTRCSENSFFPNVHIEPVNNGALILIVAYLIEKKIKDIQYSTPYDLVESLSIANFGKFSIQTTKNNNDYAGNYNKLSKSFEYVKSDLETLKPNIIIMPKKIIEHNKIIELIKDILPNSLIIPIYQITPTTINTLIHKNYPQKDKTNLGKLNEWHKNLGGKIKGKIIENYYSIYSYLDVVLDEI
jgi:hypothetical protein